MNFLQRLFSQPKAETEPETQVQVDGRVEDTQEHQPTGNLSQLPPGLHIGKLSDIGKEREQNEDSFLTFDALIQHDYGQEPFGLVIVADGMGGHQKGEVASALATRIVANHILQDVYLPYLQNNRSSTNRPINEALVAAVQSANTAVQEAAPDGGTTLTVALVMGNNAYVAHVGDTRAYLFKQDEVKQITKDHSLAQRLEELGQAAPSEVAHVKNVLYKAIGQNSTVEVDTYIQHLPPGSSLLLCSDGLWGLVEEDILKDTIRTSITPQEACQRLVAAANQSGGYDNITAIIVTMGVESQ